MHRCGFVGQDVPKTTRRPHPGDKFYSGELLLAGGPIFQSGEKKGEGRFVPRRPGFPRPPSTELSEFEFGPNPETQ